uniref:Uncharacterized protein n=1 Tax=Glossina pallidipes TaxID=7398 RepID=A0A1A9ZBZ1_GLOPL
MSTCPLRICFQVLAIPLPGRAALIAQHRSSMRVSSSLCRVLRCRCRSILKTGLMNEETYSQLIKMNNFESTLKVSTCTSPALAGQGHCKRNVSRTYYNESLLTYIT